MDPNLIKGHFFLGLSLMEISSYDEAIKHLQRGKQPGTPQKRNERWWQFPISAQDLGKEQKMNFGDDIASQVRVARKKRWQLQEEKRIAQEIELQSYLNRLINEDMERQMEKLKLDENVKPEAQEEESTKIEQQSVSHVNRRDYFQLIQLLLLGELCNGTEQLVCQNRWS
jgi:STIP1 homology and U-box containing protein 1